MSDLLNALRPGDVISARGFNWDWKHPFLSIGVAGLVAGLNKAQGKLFGNRSRHEETHTTMFFDKTKVFSCQLPKPCMIDLDAEYNNPKDNRTVTVLRYAKRELKDSDLVIIADEVDKFIALQKGYDLGQLADILVNQIAGHPFKSENKWFDQGGDRLVCSVSVAAMFEAWRHRLWQTTGEDLPQLFRKINPMAWPQSFVNKFEKYGHWDLGTTYPANFTNTELHFDGEFEIIGEFKNMKRIA